MRARLTLLATLALLVGAPLMAASQALAAPQDVASTHAYIQANYALARAMVARIGAAQTKVKRYNSQLARECPHIGEGSPQNEATKPMSHEVAVALWSLAYGTSAGPIRTFAATVSRLRWSSRAITRAAGHYARNLREMASVPLPNLCADVRSWRATGFQVISPAIIRLVDRVEAIDLSPIPARLLARYARGGDAGTLSRTQRLETKLEESEFTIGQNDWLQVLETLSLNG